MYAAVERVQAVRVSERKDLNQDGQSWHETMHVWWKKYADYKRICLMRILKGDVCICLAGSAITVEKVEKLNVE